MRTLLAILLLALAVARAARAAEPEPQPAPAPVTITELFRRAHPGQADREIVVKRIELKPGASAPLHVHPGMVTGYVEAGTLEFQLEGEAVKWFKAGDTFFEPPGSHHLVARNPDAKAATVIIAFVINPKGAPLSTPHQVHGTPP
jgi:quercetin dioxygenase-like cupin family protein